MNNEKKNKLFHINKYIPIFIIYFFFNSAGLPHGLLITTLLTPFFYLESIKYKKLLVSKFIFFLSPWLMIHAYYGVIWFTYLRSLVLFFSVYIFIVYFYLLLQKINNHDEIFEKIIIYNFIATIICVLLYFTNFWNLVFSSNVLSASFDEVRRLKMLTYEPSYYSTLCVPFFFYAFWNYNMYSSIKSLFILFAISVPLIISFSIGVITCIITSLMIVILIKYKKSLSYKKICIFMAGSIVIISFFIVDNPFIIRINDLIEGNDTSGTARTVLSLLAAIELLYSKSILFGVGFGQEKIIASAIFNYGDFWIEEGIHFRLFSTISSVLVILGFFGLVFWLCCQIYLFIKKDVYYNCYRLSLFIFIFIYQFTGSFMTNIAEYVIWVIAFSNIFNKYDMYNNRFADSLNNGLN